MLFDRLIKFFISLRLTVVCLTVAMLLVFIGTLAQVDLGLYKAQNEFFRSFFVFWGPKGAGWKIPVFPGGYLVGGFLLINLVAAHFARFKFTRQKFGIGITHFGLILLLVGQLATDMAANESSLHLRLGEEKNYSESDRYTELAVTDKSNADADTVVAIADNKLAKSSVISVPQLPFAIHVKRFYRNAIVAGQPLEGFEKSGATQGDAASLFIREMPRVTKMEEVDTPAALIELVAGEKSLGTWLVSSRLDNPQSFTFNGRNYDMILRMRRYYVPFSLQLKEFRHDVYAGTDIPKNFSSLVQVRNFETGEDREVKIKMNTPLRYKGRTYYQASFDRDDQGSVLQVVRNPSWLTPYLACALVGAGLVIQFLSHLIPFVKRKLAT
jgi:hypothetical protein